MENFNDLMPHFWWFIPLIVILSIWDTVWKLLGLWKSARNNDLIWFILIAIINTVGILPIIYLLLRKSKPEQTEQS